MAKRGINKAILVGNLGADPEAKFLPSGDAVTTFSIATSEAWKDKDGVDQQRSEWHNIVAFKKLAEICGQYLKKGAKVYIEGQLRTQSWDDKDTGKKMYRTEIVANEMQMLDSRGDNPPTAAPQSSNQPQVTQVDNNPENFDDDIPF